MAVANYILNIVNEYIDYALRESDNIEELNTVYDIFGNNVLRGIYALNHPVDPKDISGFKRIFNNNDVKSPFEIKNLIPNDAQLEIINHDYLRYGSGIFEAEPGCGKTLAAVGVIHKYKVKTLIISTRINIKEQWYLEINTTYPELKICNDNTLRDSDVYILTPQFILKNIDKPEFKKYLSNVGLIICDEIHSMFSTEFGKMLALPFEMVLKEITPELPIFLGLTGTFHIEQNNKIKEIFDKIYNPVNRLKRIRTKFIPYIDLYNRHLNRGKNDINYKKKSIKDMLKISNDILLENNYMPSNKYKLLIVVNTKDDAVEAAIRASVMFHKDAIIVRAGLRNDYYIDYDIIPAQYKNNNNDKDNKYTEDVFKNKWMTKCDFYQEQDNCAIVVGTIDKISEGFNCPNCVMGICTLFEYSIIRRIQILSRISRNSNDEDLNNHQRLFIVQSGKIPINGKKGVNRMNATPQRAKVRFINEELKKRNFYLLP